MKKWIIILAVFCTFLVSCPGNKAGLLRKEKLFTLPFGKMEDELDFFIFDDQPSSPKIRFFMKDGLFFISNQASSKIMEFNSHGDILLLIYNRLKNPAPVLLSAPENKNQIINRKAVSYPLEDVGEIVITGKNTLLVEDIVPVSRYETDEKLGAVLNRVVRRFTSNGKYIDYIGQEGIGGTPFPYINRIFVTSKDEIVVSTRTKKAWLVFWYSRDGVLLYTIEIGVDNLPVFNEANLIPSLESVYADYNKRLLYLKINYYKKVYDQSTNAVLNIDFYKSSIFWLNLESGKYEGHVDIPVMKKDLEKKGMFDEKKIDLLYELLGVTSNDNFFLLTPYEGRQQLIILNKRGRVLGKPLIDLDSRELTYREFHLSPTGLLSAVLCNKREAEIVWWRSDKILKQAANEDS